MFDPLDKSYLAKQCILSDYILLSSLKRTNTVLVNQVKSSRKMEHNDFS